MPLYEDSDDLPSFHSRSSWEIWDYLDAVLPPRVAQQELSRVLQAHKKGGRQGVMFELVSFEQSSRFESEYFTSEPTRAWALTAYALRTGNILATQCLVDTLKSNPIFFREVTLDTTKNVYGGCRHVSTNLLRLAEIMADKAYQTRSISNEKCLNFRSNLLYMLAHYCHIKGNDQNTMNKITLTHESDQELKKHRPLLFAEITAENSGYNLETPAVPINLTNQQLDEINQKLINTCYAVGLYEAQDELNNAARSYLYSHKINRNVFKKALYMRAIQNGDVNTLEMLLCFPNEMQTPAEISQLATAAFCFTHQAIQQRDKYPFSRVEAGFKSLQLLKTYRPVRAHETLEREAFEYALAEELYRYRWDQISHKTSSHNKWQRPDSPDRPRE